MRPRFDQIADRVARALRSLGVDARVGEVPGEYCPGSHSVSAGGRTKLMGVGQRLISGGAHVGGVIVVEGADRVRDILLPVYEAMGLDWRPEATGAVADEVPGVDLADVIDALRDAFAAEYELEEAQLDAGDAGAGPAAGPRAPVARATSACRGRVGRLHER